MKPAKRKPAESEWTAAAVRRLQHALDVLREHDIGEGFAIDEEAAAKAVKAIQSNRNTPLILDFLIGHGLNLDYVLRGVPDGMIIDYTRAELEGRHRKAPAAPQTRRRRAKAA